jgi:polyisoprenoid-binding protein YceI
MKLPLVAFLAIGLATGASLAQTAPTRQVDPARSKLTVHVGKAGMFSAFGHEHDIAAPVFSGAVRGQESVEFSVDARQMKVADADVSEKDRAEIQTTMLGPEVLDAARFPEIKFRSTAIESDKLGQWWVRGTLTLHGQTRPIVLSVKQAGERYTGTSTFKQTEFGIKPVSAGGGSVKVKDEVTVTFDIALK